jgi:hypothetical protein
MEYTSSVYAFFVSLFYFEITTVSAQATASAIAPSNQLPDVLHQKRMKAHCIAVTVHLVMQRHDDVIYFRGKILMSINMHRNTEKQQWSPFLFLSA